MHKTLPRAKRDQRSRPDLELFLLALIRDGVSTPYQMLRSAALSPGATLPALGRLESQGYVRRGKAGSRGRTEYRLTKSGRRYLDAGWQPLLKKPAAGDIETMLRTAALARASGAPVQLVVGYLRAAAKARSVESKRRLNGNFATPKAKAGAADLYQWMQEAHAAGRLEAEAKTLRKTASRLKSLNDDHA